MITTTIIIIITTITILITIIITTLITIIIWAYNYYLSLDRQQYPASRK